MSQEKSTLQGIIDSKGLEYCLDTESAIGCEIVCDRVVIATGGSMVMAKDAMEYLRELGTVVYINVPLDELRRRLGNYKDRGIAMKDGESLETIFSEREPYYKKYADITVDYISGNDLEQTVDNVIDKLNI